MLKSIWQWILDSIDALVADDHRVERERLEYEKRHRRHLHFLSHPP